MQRRTEDCIVLGGLAAVPLWAFVILPFFVLSPPSQMSREMASINWILLAASFLGGSMAALLIKTIIDYVRRPRISAVLVPRLGCYVTTGRGDPPTHVARFLRLRIENVGYSTVKDCRGYITAITKTTGAQRLPVQQEVLELQWSGGGAPEARNLPQGAFFYMDIASLDLVQGPHVLRLGTRWMPNHMAGLLDDPGSFELAVKVAADNAKPVNRNVVFAFDPNDNDLAFQFD